MSFQVEFRELPNTHQAMLGASIERIVNKHHIKDTSTTLEYKCLQFFLDLPIPDLNLIDCGGQKSAIRRIDDMRARLFRVEPFGNLELVSAHPASGSGMSTHNQ